MLSGSCLTDDGLTALAQAGGLPKLEFISFGDDETDDTDTFGHPFTPRGWQAFAEALKNGAWPKLDAVAAWHDANSGCTDCFPSQLEAAERSKVRTRGR